MAKISDFEVTSITGERVSLSTYDGQTCLIVNVATKCGLTPQYEGLESLHEAHRERGFTVLAFPCNQFGGQEPGTDAEILDFATSKYGVTFPLFSKIEVNGDGAAELYTFLKSEAPGADGGGDIRWNFTKFLVDKSGRVVKRYEPQVTPDAIAADLTEYL